VNVTSTSANSSRSTRIWILLLVALAIFSFLAMRRSMVKAMGMRAESSVGASPQPLKVGDEVKLVLEVTGVAEAATVEGNVLAKESETVYRRTSNTAKIGFDTETPVVMGKVADVRAGSVVHVAAKMGADRVLHASKIVILTGYVKVQ
jgi:hypothetical protein